MMFKGFCAGIGNVDKNNDIFNSDCFRDCLEKWPQVPLLWNHDLDKVVGVAGGFEERHGKLWCEFIVWDLPGHGQAAISLLNAKARLGMSVGFRAVNSRSNVDSSGIRSISKADLIEVSLTMDPANNKCFVDYS